MNVNVSNVTSFLKIIPPLMKGRRCLEQLFGRDRVGHNQTSADHSTLDKSSSGHLSQNFEQHLLPVG